MCDLIDFINPTDVPIITQAAIAHAQFETIHPFPDGNGRTGRALIHAVLHRGGLTRNLTVPVSAGLLRDPHAYFDALSAYRDGDVDAIVHAITYASFAAIDNGRRLVADIIDVRDGWSDIVKARSDSSVHRLLDLLLGRPVITVTTAARALGPVAPGPRPPTAARGRMNGCPSRPLPDARPACAPRARRRTRAGRSTPTPLRPMRARRTRQTASRTTP